MSVSTYLTNAFNMMRDWSKDRAGEKQFETAPHVPELTWIMAYDFLYKDQAVISQLGSTNVYISAKKENKDLIIPIFVKGKYDQMKVDFDSFINYFTKVRIIKLNNETWAKSKCSCGFFMKNYNCYHLISVAANLKLTEIPNTYKHVNIEKKSKRGRKAKAKKALLRN